MKRLHDAPLTEVAGTPVTLQKDYLTGQMTVPGQAAEPMELKDSDVVAYDLADALKMPGTFDENLYSLIDVLGK